MDKATLEFIAIVLGLLLFVRVVWDISDIICGRWQP